MDGGVLVCVKVEVLDIDVIFFGKLLNEGSSVF